MLLSGRVHRSIEVRALLMILSTKGSFLQPDAPWNPSQIGEAVRIGGSRKYRGCRGTSGVEVAGGQRMVVGER